MLKRTVIMLRQLPVVEKRHMAGTEFQTGPNGTMPRIVTSEDVLGGDPRIENRRIGVYHVYQQYVEGNETPEAIATSYEIPVAEVHIALAYAFSNHEEIRDIAVRNQAQYEELSGDRVTPDDIN